MPREHFTGNDNYNVMACHVFALSGNPGQAANVNERYQTLGNLLRSQEAPPANNNVAAGMNTLTNQQIRDALAELPGGDLEREILGLLCVEFGLVQQANSGIRLWGHFEDNQMLPEHMYVTHTDGKIYDTMPNAPIRRRGNNQGRNPPSYGDDKAGHDILLETNVIFSVEIAALAAGTQAVVGTPNNQWANG